jgi:thiol-disulfide isomerase/thioredoxin
VTLAALVWAAPAARAAEPEPPLGLMPWKGGRTPSLVLPDLAANPVSLRDFRGKTVVVNFWATWCQPCVDELPALVRLRARFPPSELVVLLVNVVESRERVRPFLAELDVKLPVLLDEDGVTSRAWKVVGLPTSFVVGSDGRIRAYFVGELDWTRDDVVRALEALRPARPRAQSGK